MAIRFEAIEPSYALTGTAPLYKLQFIDDGTGGLVDPDSVDSLQVFDSGGNQLRVFFPPDLQNPGVGEYQVQDQVLADPDVLQLRWSYTVGGTPISVVVPFEVVNQATGSMDTLVKNQVLQMLGQGHVRVSLPAGTLETCLYRSKQWYAQHIGQNHRVVVPIIPGQSEYDLPADVNYVFDITLPSSVNRVSDALSATGIYGFSMLGMKSFPVQDVYGMSGKSQGFYSTIVQSMQYAEMGSRILGGGHSWEYTPWNNKINLAPAPQEGGNMFVDYVSVEVDLERKKPTEFNFVSEYCLALAKEALGRIRGKYQSLPGVDGQIVMDADTLLSESAEAKRDLTERIRYWAPAGWIITG